MVLTDGSQSKDNQRAAPSYQLINATQVTRTGFRTQWEDVVKAVRKRKVKQDVQLLGISNTLVFISQAVIV